MYSKINNKFNYKKLIIFLICVNILKNLFFFETDGVSYFYFLLLVVDHRNGYYIIHQLLRYSNENKLMNFVRKLYVSYY